MTELLTYDKGYLNYISKFKVKKLPLICWNFYSEFIGSLYTSLNDQYQLTQIAVTHRWKTPFQLNKMMQHDTVVVVTCPKLKIVFATQNIEQMNGYQPCEVIGKSPKIFQGEATCPVISKEISLAIQNKQPFDKIVTNYCKNGSLYYCHIQGFPVFNKTGKLVNFIAFEKAA
jgi:PAS domain S-box-containing protein